MCNHLYLQLLWTSSSPRYRYPPHQTLCGWAAAGGGVGVEMYKTLLQPTFPSNSRAPRRASRHHPLGRLRVAPPPPLAADGATLPHISILSNSM